MKKRILSILLTLCMVLMLVPATAFADEGYYTITQNFKYGAYQSAGVKVETSPYTHEETAIATFSLGTVEDCGVYEFVGWKETGSGTVYESYASILPESNLTFDAVYQVQGGLTITVDGFMPGNTPNDCTVTMESTIPGITFSKDDIMRIKWYKPYFNGIDYSPQLMYNGEAFEADTAYQFTVDLNNKGLELAPSTTVNGIEPFVCRIGSSYGVPYILNICCELGTPVAPTLAVTVDNFEVGKTPADITYSFASTNLGVTFSEEDILANFGGWEYYSGEADEWLLMSNTEVFEAGTRYRCAISLDNKGLDTAPAATVNGKTPEFCGIATKDGVPIGLQIACILGTPPEPALTISGPDVVCAEQDYEFSATAAEGVTIVRADYGNYYKGADVMLTPNEDDVLSGVVRASGFAEYGDSFQVTVYGMTADGTPATATKIVRVSQDHIFVDGVCGCGAKPEYTITYDGGEGVEGSIDPETKADGVPVTLSSETFVWDGFIQTGWIDKETGAIYELGATYDEDRDVTLYPYWEKLVTVTADFTTTVALGDAGEPGETTFWLGLVDSEGYELTFDDRFIGAEITTDGAGSYSGTMTITATGDWLYDMLYEGAFIWQYDGEEEGWTYDDTVWGVRLYMPEVAARSADAVEYSLLLYPAYDSSTGVGFSFRLDLNAGPVDEMTFTNTYTAHAYALNHDADGHWDECSGCKDKQNEEPHTYGDWKVTKEATETAVGEKEHTCTVCGYTETEEIAKLTRPGTEIPQTGDNSNFALWFASFAMSAAALIAAGVYSKRRRSSRAK